MNKPNFRQSYDKIVSAYMYHTTDDPSEESTKHTEICA